MGRKKEKVLSNGDFSKLIAAQSRAESESEASGTFLDPSKRNGGVEISKKQDWGLYVRSLSKFLRRYR